MSWIKLHRRFLEWEWADCPNMVSLFIHLLLNANFEDKEWHGMMILRGQLVTSYDKLSSVTGLSIRSLRTCLAKLEQTGEIVRKATKQFTIITICKYDSYQDFQQTSDKRATNERQTSDKRATNERQTSDKQATITKEIKNNKNNIVEDIAHARTRLEDQTINNSLWVNQAAMNLRTDQVTQLAIEVLDEWELTKIPTEEYTAYHLLNHMRRKLERSANGKPSKSEWERGLAAGAIQAINKIYNQ